MKRIPDKPLQHKGRNLGYVLLTTETKDGKKKRRSKYFKGPFGSIEMWDDFNAWRRQQLGQTSAERPTLDQAARQPGQQGSTTVGQLCQNFLAILKHERNHEKPEETKADRAAVTLAVRTLALLDPFAAMGCNDFNSAHMVQVRDIEISKGNSRKTINEKMQLIVRMFRKATHLDSVGCLNDTWYGLLAWENDERLNGKQHKHVPGPKDVPAADLADVEATIAAAPPLIACMITVHAYTGMRSENVAELSYDQIDRSRYDAAGVWIYTPTHHKEESSGNTLAPVFGPTAIQAILDYENVRPDRGHPFIFNPRAGRSWRYYNEHLGSRDWKSFYKASKKSDLNQHYSTDTYGQAVQRVQKNIGVKWNPHQLRHLHNQRVAESEFGDRGAAAVIGHASLKSTRNYSKTQDMEHAIEVQKQYG